MLRNRIQCKEKLKPPSNEKSESMQRKTPPPGESNPRNQNQCGEKLHRPVKAIREIKINVEKNFTTR